MAAPGGMAGGQRAAILQPFSATVPPEPAEDAVATRLGDRLIALKLLSPDQVDVALREKTRSGKRLGEVLVELGFLTTGALAQVLADAAGLERFDPGTTIVDPAAARLLPQALAARHQMLPVALSDADRTVQLAMADVHDLPALDQARRYLPAGYRVEPMVCADGALQDLIAQHFGFETSIDGILREIEDGGTARTSDADPESYRNPTVRLVNALLVDAVNQGASDIHFEPEGAFVRLRYRIDGVLHQVRTFHKDYWSSIAVRLKVMASLNIADARNPQDGRFSYRVAAREVDFRVASLPTVHGENIVLRILDKTRSLVPLEELGFGDRNVALLKRLLLRPEGLILVTGPTGSGKTTTLYSMLDHLSTPAVNIMTLEDPVEYRLPLIRQSEVREGSQLNFADGVRSILRQDPDIILVGEVRDRESAQMAIRAAITGHRVFTTLHTNDALGTVSRLVDIGIPVDLLAGNIICAIAQRLARRLCGECKRGAPATAEACRLLGIGDIDPPVIHTAVGCEACRHTGYRGRIALVEILRFDDRLDELVASGGNRHALRAVALESGFVPMIEDGTAKVLDGTTSLDELIAAVDMTQRM